MVNIVTRKRPIVVYAVTENHLVQAIAAILESYRTGIQIQAPHPDEPFRLFFVAQTVHYRPANRVNPVFKITNPRVQRHPRSEAPDFPRPATPIWL